MGINNNYVKATVGLALAVSSVPIIAPAYMKATTYSDVSESAYYYDAVQELAERGIINGYGDATFKPNEVATRGQTAKILASILGLDTINVVDPGFTDLSPDNPYYGAIAALVQAGIINGYEDRTFRMNEPLKRNHLAKMLVKAFDLQSPEGVNLPFTDVHQSYKDYILALYANEITTGRTETEFDGESYVTRGQLAAFVVRTEVAVQEANEQPNQIPTPPSEQILTPNAALTFTLSIEGMSELFSSNDEYDLMTSAVIGKMYLEGDVVKITFVSEEVIPKGLFKVKIRNIEYEFSFNQNENKWSAKEFKEPIVPVPDSTPPPVATPVPVPTPKPPSTISVTGISLNSTTATIKQGETAQLTASILPSNATNKSVTWTSSDENIATVDAIGKVTAISLGNTTITGETVDGAKLATATIEVVPVPVTGITLNQTTESLNVGQTTTLLATVTPTNAANKNVTWTSSVPTVATVDATGKVTAIGLGNTTITAETVDGAKLATATIEVVPVPVTGVTLNPIMGSLNVGETTTLVATVTPTNATNKSVTWTSSDENIATVDATGKVTAIGVGTTTITAETVDGTKLATTTYTVTQKVLSVTAPTVASKEYDGTTAAAVTPGTVTGIAPGEDVLVNATGTFDNAEVGNGKTVEVTYSLSGTDAPNYAAPGNTIVTTGEITAAPLTAVTITGIPLVGQGLTASSVSPAEATVTYQWQIADTATGTYKDILLATSKSYTLVEGDLGKFIKVVVTGTGNYTGTATSKATTEVVNTRLISANIYGTPQVGVQIGTEYGYINVGWELYTFTFQWQIADTATGTYNDILLATSPLYTPVAGDAGKFIRFVVTETGRYTGTVTSNGVLVITPQ